MPESTEVNSIGIDLAKQCAVAAFNLAWGIVKAKGQALWDELKLREAMASYVERYLQRHGQVNVLGMGRPIPLLQIYTDVQIVPPNFLRTMESVEAMEQAFIAKGDARGFGQHSAENRASGMEAVQQYQFLNVLGQPGAGKSTFLKRIGLEALLPKDGFEQSIKDQILSSAGLVHWSSYRHNCLPVLIELRRFRDETIDLRTLIINEFAIAGIPNADSFVDHSLQQGKLLLLLDGLDEVPANKLDLTIEHIRDFVDRFGRIPWGEGEKSVSAGTNRFVTSCRTAFYKSYFPRFTDVVLADFDESQINGFIQRWFVGTKDGERVAAGFMAALSEEEHAATLELARTPLLLTFLCLVYDDTNRLPANRSALYRRALLILLEKWAAEKRIHNETVYKDLHSEFELHMLAELAGKAYEANHFFFSKKEITSSISAFLQDELKAPPHLNAAQVLEAIEVQQGLLVQRADDVYSFSHLTIQEYLSAEYFLENGKLLHLVSDRVDDPRWREVFMMSAGIAPKADELLEALTAKTIGDLKAIPRMEALLVWVGRNTKNASQNSGPLERATAILYLFSQDMSLELGRPADLAIANGRVHLDKIVNALSVAGCKPAFSMRGLGAEIDQYRRQLNIRNIEVKEIEKFSEYLRKCQLVIDCKNSALRVSKICWTNILSRLLAPRER